MEELEAEHGIKLHTKGRVTTSQAINTDDDTFSFKGGRSTGIIKFLEPLNPLLNYFEYMILNKGRETAIGVGCGDRGYSMSRMPGWNRNSCGYHADDGKLYHESGMGRAFGPTCTTGDRMGCGVNFNSGRVQGTVELFFTKNGNQVGGIEIMKRPQNGIYPLIGLHSEGEKVQYLGHWRRIIDGFTEPMEEDESPETRWLRCNGVKFIDDGLTLEYAGMGVAVQDVGIAQSRYNLNRTNHYFEIEIIEGGVKGAVAIGLGKTTYPLHRHPGWNQGGIGYHADDGKLFKGKGQGDQFGPPCHTGDRMGCGISFPLEPGEREDEGRIVSDSDDSDAGHSLPDGDLQQAPLYLIRTPSSHSSTEDEDLESDLESEESYSGDSLMEQFMLHHEPLRVPRLGGGHLFGRGGVGRQWRDALLDDIEPYHHAIQMAGRIAGGGRRVQKGATGNRGSGRTCTVYFTKNGEKVGDVECDVPRGGFYPMVAMLSLGEKIRVNFNPLSG